MQQIHPGVVHQCGLVQADVQAIVGAQSQRSLRNADFRKRRAVVEVFFAVPLQCRNPPCGGGSCDGKFGQLLDDLRFLQFGLPGHVVAKANAIIEYPEHHVELAVIHVFFDETGA